MGDNWTKLVKRHTSASELAGISLIEGDMSHVREG
jgi:hypothetical protein